MSDTLRIATFNANSIRSRTGIILDWMVANRPDVLCVQETKVDDARFPEAAFAEAGYFCAYFGQKSYNGVALIAPQPLEGVVKGLGRMPEDEEARVIRAVVKGVPVVNTYVPQGTSLLSPRFRFKIDWIRGLTAYFESFASPTDPVVWAGDLNVALEPIDVYDPVRMLGSLCYHPEEKVALESVARWGFVDIFRKHHPAEEKQYTFWDYRLPSALKRHLGWRLDYIWATEPLARRSLECRIDTAPRAADKPSDHTFVVADFALD